MKELAGELKVLPTKPNNRSQIMVIIEMSASSAIGLFKTASIKIGWVNCRVRRKTLFEDRSKLCYKCEQTGHKAVACTLKLKYVLCEEMKADQDELAHVPGSGKCQAFRSVLERDRIRWMRKYFVV